MLGMLMTDAGRARCVVPLLWPPRNGSGNRSRLGYPGSYLRRRVWTAGAGFGFD